MQRLFVVLALMFTILVLIFSALIVEGWKKYRQNPDDVSLIVDLLQMDYVFLVSVMMMVLTWPMGTLSAVQLNAISNGLGHNFVNLFAIIVIILGLPIVLATLRLTKWKQQD